MVTPELSALCPTCRTLAADQLNEVLERTRPLHQVDLALQSWFHAGDHLATLRHRYKSEHLFGAVMVAILALVFDFLSALAQKYLKPKGL